MQIKEYLQITKYDDSIHVLCSLRRTQNGLLSFRNIPNFSVQDVYGTYTRYVSHNSKKVNHCKNNKLEMKKYSDGLGQLKTSFLE